MAESKIGWSFVFDVCRPFPNYVQVIDEAARFSSQIRERCALPGREPQP